MKIVDKYNNESRNRIAKMLNNKNLLNISKKFMEISLKEKYPYNFTWFDIPIIQYPADIIAIQEVIWKIKPDLIIETGIAHGGSLILSAASLALLDLNDAVQQGTTLDPTRSKRLVIGVDVDIRKLNRKEIENHFLFSRIKLVEGSSTDPKIISKIKQFSEPFKTVMVMLDSNHTKDHVLNELIAYAPLVSRNSYCIVFDTVIEDLSGVDWVNRSWGLGNNPKIAVDEFLKINSNFEIDKNLQNKLQITVAPDGYLKRINL